MQLLQTIHFKLVSDSLAAFNSHFFPIQLDIFLIANPEIPKRAELQQYEPERHENYQNCAYLIYSVLQINMKNNMEKIYKPELYFLFYHITESQILIQKHIKCDRKSNSIYIHFICSVSSFKATHPTCGISSLNLVLWKNSRREQKKKTNKKLSETKQILHAIYNHTHWFNHSRYSTRNLLYYRNHLEEHRTVKHWSVLGQ